MVKKLESLINLRLAMIHKAPIQEIEKKYLEYLNEYDNLENKGIKEKLEHRELFYSYMRYMNRAKK